MKRTLKASTHASYSYVLHHYVLTQIGAVRVDKLTTPRVQQLINSMVDAEHSPSTIRNCYLRLRALLDVAVQYRYVTHNVAVAVKLPKIGMGDQCALTISEVQRLFVAIDGHRNAALFHCLLVLGLRRGEVLGLAWRDLDWDAATIKVTQQVQTIDNKTIISTPKTETSRRTLPLTADLTRRLHDHWRNQQEERRIRGVDWKEHGLIFASETGTPINPRNLNRTFSAALAQAALPPMRLHDCRHTCATLLGELGIADRVIGALLGHTPANITARYAHATLAAMREAVEQLEGVLLKKAA